MTEEQKRIGELFGTVAVLETVIQNLIAQASGPGSSNDILEKQLSAIIEQNQAQPDDEWADHHASGMRATATRLSAFVRLAADLNNRPVSR
ncbi:hypothetical protein [Thioclava sp. GXIMD2076]|uniref:hypothetical protein n=1 Tax=Thioclava sp. GXIMD2076 TaxID=3131931 RepID=UPI0030D2F2B4